MVYLKSRENQLKMVKEVKYKWNRKWKKMTEKCLEMDQTWVIIAFNWSKID